MRAFVHHELVINFCRPFVDGTGSNPGVPYRTVDINTLDKVQPALDLKRGTVAEDYTKILENLDFAEANLLPVRTASKITRATSGAAIALKHLLNNT